MDRSRVILHLDLDAFYAQVEQMRLNLTADVPIGVAQHTMLIAVSYAARPFGVKRIDSVETAKQKCPQIVIAYVETKNNKPNLTRYRDASVKIFEVLNAAGAKSLERGSVDEAYMDVSNLVDERMARDEAQPSWPLKFEGSVVVAGEDFAGAAAADIDDDLVTDANADRTVCTRLWWGAEISKELRKQIFQKLGYTVSCGVSFNKTLAKIGSGKNKPDNQTVVLPSSVMFLLQQLPIRKLPGLGGKFGDRVVQVLQLEHAFDLTKYSLATLQSHFGDESGQWLYNICRGNDFREVRDKSSAGCKTIVKQIASEMHERCTIDRETNQRVPRTVSINYRDSKQSRSLVCPKFDLTSDSKFIEVLWDTLQSADTIGQISSFGCDAHNFDSLSGMSTIESFFTKSSKRSSTTTNDAVRSTLPSFSSSSSSRKRELPNDDDDDDNDNDDDDNNNNDDDDVHDNDTMNDDIDDHNVDDDERDDIVESNDDDDDDVVVLNSQSNHRNSISSTPAIRSTTISSTTATTISTASTTALQRVASQTTTLSSFSAAKTTLSASTTSVSSSSSTATTSGAVPIGRADADDSAVCPICSLSFSGRSVLECSAHVEKCLSSSSSSSSLSQRATKHQQIDDRPIAAAASVAKRPKLVNGQLSILSMFRN